jgi:hypothetical protein
LEHLKHFLFLQWPVTGRQPAGHLIKRGRLVTALELRNYRFEIQEIANLHAWFLFCFAFEGSENR